MTIEPVTVDEAIKYIESIAPLSLQTDTDNSGLQAGDTSKHVEVICVAYEKDLKTLERAASIKCDLLVVHRPLYLSKRFPRMNTRFFRTAESIIRENEMVVYSAHESWDFAEGGTADSLCRVLGLEISLREGQHRMGIIHRRKFSAFRAEVEKLLKPKYMISATNTESDIRIVGCVAGTGMNLDDIEFFINHGADCYLSGDPDDFGIRYGRDSGLSLICVDDYSLERPGLIELRNRLKMRFPFLKVLFLDEDGY